MSRSVFRLSRFAKLLAAGLLLYYLGSVVMLYIRQDQLVFHPESDWSATPNKIGLDYEDVQFSTGDGTRLSGWFVPAVSSKGTVLFCHKGTLCPLSSDLKPKARAFVPGTFHTDLAPHQLHQLLADRQSQAGAFVLLTERSFNLCKFLEESCLVPFGDPDPGIDHVKMES